eukprot:gene1978-biopygen6411
MKPILISPQRTWPVRCAPCCEWICRVKSAQPYSAGRRRPHPPEGGPPQRRSGAAGGTPPPPGGGGGGFPPAAPQLLAGAPRIPRSSRGPRPARLPLQAPWLRGCWWEVPRRRRLRVPGNPGRARPAAAKAPGLEHCANCGRGARPPLWGGRPSCSLTDHHFWRPGIHLYLAFPPPPQFVKCVEPRGRSSLLGGCVLSRRPGAVTGLAQLLHPYIRLSRRPRAQLVGPLPGAAHDDLRALRVEHRAGEGDGTARVPADLHIAQVPPLVLPAHERHVLPLLLQGSQDTGVGVARAWRGQGAGCRQLLAWVARAWRGQGAGCRPLLAWVARAWRGRGAGVARAWRGQGAALHTPRSRAAATLGRGLPISRRLPRVIPHHGSAGPDWGGCMTEL